MTLDIRAGMFAVLRDGTVPEQPIEFIDGGSKWRWATDGETYMDDGRYDPHMQDPLDIVSVHATRADALAYVAENPMNRELYPDGPDLAPAPVTAEDICPDCGLPNPSRNPYCFCRPPAPAPVVVDWKARAEALEAALFLADDGCNFLRMYPALADDPDGKAKARAILAAAKEPRHE